MAKKAKTQQPAEKCSPCPGTEELQERVVIAWRAILGLPPDFPILPFQITVCMATAQALLTTPR